MKTKRLLLILALIVAIGIPIAWHELHIKHTQEFGLSLFRLKTPDFLAPLNSLSLNIASSPEQDRGKDYLWAYGPETEISFKTRAPLPMSLCFSTHNIIEGQSLTVTVNGEKIGRLDSLRANPPGVDDDHPCLRFSTRPGMNTVRIAYGRWNHHPDAFAPGDPRLMALRFTRFRLGPAEASGSGS